MLPIVHVIGVNCAEAQVVRLGNRPIPVPSENSHQCCDGCSVRYSIGCIGRHLEGYYSSAHRSRFKKETDVDRASSRPLAAYPTSARKPNTKLREVHPTEAVLWTEAVVNMSMRLELMIKSTFLQK